MPTAKGSDTSLIEPTDLYLIDPTGKGLSVPYPFDLVVGLVAAGFIAFAFVGFLGYPTDSRGMYTIFHPAWMLFLWFAAMILIVQWSIFRHKVLARVRWESVIITLICIGIVSAAYEQPQMLSDLVNRIADLLSAAGISVDRGRLLWTLANFAPIVLYVADRATLWLRGERAQHKNIVGAPLSPPTDQGRLTWWELFTQDLFAGAALCVALGIFFQTVVLNAITHQVVGARVDTCAVSWASGVCVPGGSSNPPTLTSIDLALAFFAFAASVILLAIFLFSRVVFQSQSEGAKTVEGGLRETLLAVFNPLDVLVRDLRIVLWPALTLGGIVGAASCARYIRLYLHLLSDKQTCGNLGDCPDLREFAGYLSSSLNAHSFQAQALRLEVLFLAFAIAGGVGGTLAIVAAARTHLAGRQVSGPLALNWVRFLFEMAKKVLLVFWIASIGLSLFMLALQYVHWTTRAPFPQIGVSTAISLAYFLGYEIWLRFVSRLIRR